ncbi:hypothetical protein AB0C34_21205 [Nocardia sp. NPDC049220]|uniref:hypothetical protein n=1 Tax=Nocardia sp. NPDC049220 TaxID=3155273 RepID=UPI0033C29066
MITGVSLGAVDATLVLLRRVGGNYQPIALGISGSYNRLGAIDGITKDANTDLILRYFLDAKGAGRFFTQDQTSNVDVDWLPPDAVIDDLVHVVERTTSFVDDDLYQPSSVLDGVPIVFALIAQPVWDALTITASGKPVADLFAAASSECGIAEEIYRGQLAQVDDQVRQFAAVSDFLATRERTWAPSGTLYLEEGEQHGFDDMTRFLDRARREFHDAPVLLTGLAVYERQIADLADN